MLSNLFVTKSSENTLCNIATETNHRNCTMQHITQTSNLTSIIEVLSASAHLFASTWRPLVSVITTLYYVAIIFHHRVWYCALSLHYVCIQSSGIILIP